MLDLLKVYSFLFNDNILIFGDTMKAKWLLLTKI